MRVFQFEEVYKQAETDDLWPYFVILRRLSSGNVGDTYDGGRMGF